jgi:hypothetical protein
MTGLGAEHHRAVLLLLQSNFPYGLQPSSNFSAPNELDPIRVTTMAIAITKLSLFVEVIFIIVVLCFSWIVTFHCVLAKRFVKTLRNLRAIRVVDARGFRPTFLGLSGTGSTSLAVAGQPTSLSFERWSECKTRLPVPHPMLPGSTRLLLRNSNRSAMHSRHSQNFPRDS